MTEHMTEALSRPNAVVHIEVHGLGDGKIDLKVYSSGVELSDSEVKSILTTAALAIDLGNVEHATCRECGSDQHIDGVHVSD